MRAEPASHVSGFRVTMTASVDPLACSFGNVWNRVFAEAVRSQSVVPRYFEVVPLMPTDNDGEPLTYGVSMMTSTL